MLQLSDNVRKTREVCGMLQCASVTPMAVQRKSVMCRLVPVCVRRTLMEPAVTDVPEATTTTPSVSVSVRKPLPKKLPIRVYH